MGAEFKGSMGLPEDAIKKPLQSKTFNSFLYLISQNTACVFLLYRSEFEAPAVIRYDLILRREKNVYYRQYIRKFQPVPNTN